MSDAKTLGDKVIDYVLNNEIRRLRDINKDLLEACLLRIDEWHADNRNFTRKEPKSLAMMRAAVLKAAEGRS